MPGGDARGRVRAAAGIGLSESTRRWLISPQGLLAACREAAHEEDVGFFDDMDTSSVLSYLDEESLEAPGPAPSARARALVCAGRLAMWCRGDGAVAGIEEWLAAAVRGFSGPDDAPFAPPSGTFDSLGPPAADPRKRAEALVAEAYETCPHPALLPVCDLLEDFVSGPEEPKASPGTRVPLLISRHQQGELVHFVAVRRGGPPGVGLDPVVGPFTRADGAFHEAVGAAWVATDSPSLSARWSIISDRTGAAVEVIGGRSVGAAAGTALRYLTRPGLAPLDASWAITGALDDTGAVMSLLGDDRNLATYRTKLAAAGDRTVLVPACDHPYITSIVDGGNLRARLRPVASLNDITDAAQRHADARPEAPHPPPPPAREARVPALPLIAVAVIAIAAGVVLARVRGMDLVTASGIGAGSALLGWSGLRLARRRSSPRLWTAAAVAAACVLPVGAGGLVGVRSDLPRGPQTMRTFELPPGSRPGAIVADKQGNLWFSETALGRIGRISSAGERTEFAIPQPPGDPVASPARPQALALGPDGNVWFLANDVIGKVTPKGRFTMYRLDGTGAGALVAGPDGNMWVTQEVPKIARVTPGGEITEFPVPLGDVNFQKAWNAAPGIAVGRDGNLWFTEARGRIGRITPAGEVTEYSLPTPDTEPGEIIAGPDGNLWFVEVGVKGKIGRITPSGNITEFDLMRLSQPQHLTVGADGAIWFTELGMTGGSMRINGASRIGRIDPKHPDVFPWYLPLPNDFDPGGLVSGGDRNLWFTERVKHQIVTLPAVVPSGLRSVGPEVGQSFLAAIDAFHAEFGPADDQLVTAREGTDLEHIKASYARQGEILRSFATRFSELTFPPDVGDEVRAVNEATSDVQAVTDQASTVTSIDELRLRDVDKIGLTLKRADAFDSWYVALNRLGTHLGLERTRNGPVAAGKGSPQPSSTSRTVPKRPVPATLPAGRPLITGEKFPPVALDAKGRSDPQQWPEACTMLTDAEIDAIAPGVTVTRTVLSGPWSVGQTPKNTSCTYELRRPSNPSPGPDRLSVNLLDVATPTSGPGSFAEAKARAAAAGRLRPENYRDYGATLGADEAFWDGSRIECLVGPFRFSVYGHGSRPGTGDHLEWRDKVLAPAVTTLSAKMR